MTLWPRLLLLCVSCGQVLKALEDGVGAQDPTFNENRRGLGARSAKGGGALWVFLLLLGGGGGGGGVVSFFWLARASTHRPSQSVGRSANLSISQCPSVSQSAHLCQSLSRRICAHQHMNPVQTP